MKPQKQPNEVTITVNISDALLAKLAAILVEPTIPQGIPMGLLGNALRPPAPPTPPKEKAKVGFKIK
jgi:hypothetical protein